MSEETDNVYTQYRADADRVAAMLETVARLDRRMRGRGSKLSRYARHLGQEIEANERPWVLHPGPFNPDAGGTAETERYFQTRAWNLRMCGRAAVGVGLKKDSEKVFHASCKDRLCPICQARSNAHGAVAIGRLMREQIGAGKRLFFWTLTIKHGKGDSCQDVARALQTAWARFIRRKAVRETWAERLRVLEVEFTKDNGWHWHFHGLCIVHDGLDRAALPPLDLERTMKRQWKDVTGRLGRRSYGVDFRELVPHGRNEDTGEISHVRYWLRPKDHRKALAKERDGSWELWRNGAQIYRVQPIGAVVSELTKYVTKRHATAEKRNQVSFYDWTPEMLADYALAIKGMNIRRASDGWAQVLLDFQEEEILARELEAAQGDGYEYIPWAEIIEDCKLAAVHQLTDAEAQRFAEQYPRILKAFEREGCDVSADQIRGYILRFFGDTGAPLQKLRATPWQRREQVDRKHSERMRRLDDAELMARHYRMLLWFRRREETGRRVTKLSRLGMSRERHAETFEALTRQQLLKEDEGEWRLSVLGTALLARLSARRLIDPTTTRADRRAQYQLWRKEHEQAC